MLICAVYDKKAMVFFPPFTVENKVVAIRGVEGTVNAVGNVLNSYPDDFALYTLGEFDSKIGKLIPYELKILECECRQLVRPMRSQDFNPVIEESHAPSGAEAAIRKE